MGKKKKKTKRKRVGFEGSNEKKGTFQVEGNSDTAGAGTPPG